MPVVGFDVTSKQPFAGGASFGETGSYTRIDGRLAFAVDPAHEANATIVDLDLAPRDGDGRVHFSADVTLIVPDDAARANGCLILDVPNRGRPLLGWFLNRSGIVGIRDAQDPFAPGDGFAYAHGFAVASVGWQIDLEPVPGALMFDAPIAGSAEAPLAGVAMAELRPMARVNSWPLTALGNRSYPPADREEPAARLVDYAYEDAAGVEVPRERWQFACDEDGAVHPSDGDVTLEDGFEPGHVYRVSYSALNPPVAGAGLLALRDAATYLRGGAQGNLGEGFERVITLGISQTGRVLREVLYLGLNRDEAGTLAFDGVFSLIAGGIRGEFNHRFAQPSTLLSPGFGHLAPFADQTVVDPLTGRSDGLLRRLHAIDAMPKVVHANSAWEYWRGDAGLIQIDPGGTRDLVADQDARVYLFAGTHHGMAALPQTVEFGQLGFRLRYGLNVVDSTALARAALLNLDRWIAEGEEPPPSMHPRLDDGSAVPREEVLRRFADVAGIEPMDPASLPGVRATEMGPDAERGVAAHLPAERERYPCFVSDVDEDLNEVAGVRLPDLTVPVGSHTGWNAQDAPTGDPRLAAPFAGLSRFFARDVSDRPAGDRRRPLGERYASRAAYLQLVREATDRLVADLLVLAEDIELVVGNCAARYDEALRVGAQNPQNPPAG